MGARSFYGALLPTIGIRMLEDYGTADGSGWLVFGTGAPVSPFFVVASGRPSFWREGDEAARSPLHIAFRAPTRQSVDDFHRCGIDLGAADKGSPGIRRPPYHCAFLLDADGNNIEAGLYI